MSDSPKVVPPRNDQRPEPVFVKATIVDQQTKPGFVRKWFAARDERHPSYYRNYLKASQIGDPEVGYCQAGPWRIVPQDEAEQGRKRDDDGKSLDTGTTHGDLVLMETTEDNYRVHQKYEQLRERLKSQKLRQGDFEVHSGEAGGRATYKARVGVGTAYSDHRELLNQNA